MRHLKDSYSLWEMLAGIPALHAQYDREDALELHLQRREKYLDELGLPPREAHLGPQNDYALLLEEFEGFLSLTPVTDKHITAGDAGQVR